MAVSVRHALILLVVALHQVSGQSSGPNLPLSAVPNEEKNDPTGKAALFVSIPTSLCLVTSYCALALISLSRQTFPNNERVQDLWGYEGTSGYVNSYNYQFTPDRLNLAAHIDPGNGIPSNGTSLLTVALS